ncbi:hypothetical protein Syn7502_01068 [Synechococcus sp. PCC 7502]|nr:hypothetical protein Syn7502_01068 [Synechococcus sp. PCC 7502]
MRNHNLVTFIFLEIYCLGVYVLDLGLKISETLILNSGKAKGERRISSKVMLINLFTL